LVHGRAAEAETIVREIETHCARFDAAQAPKRIRVVHADSLTFTGVMRVMFEQYRSRSLLGLVLMVAQAFFYNAIFFTYALTLTTFYQVPPESVGHYLLPFALGNFLGPVLLGRLFDSLGRRVMIAFTYAASGLLLLLTGYLFHAQLLTAETHTLLWSCAFFFASAAASSAYLTVSEIFPLELRGLAIAVFYAIGTGTGGLLAPTLFGMLIESRSRTALFMGYALGSTLMLMAAGVAWKFGVAAERRSLEDIARPLCAVD
jgi:MFS family permease